MGLVPGGCLTSVVHLFVFELFMVSILEQKQVGELGPAWLWVMWYLPLHTVLLVGSSSRGRGSCSWHCSLLPDPASSSCLGSDWLKGKLYAF